MTSAESDPVTERTPGPAEGSAEPTSGPPQVVTNPTSGPPEVGAEPPRTRRRWPWLALLALVLAAVLGTALGVGVVLRGRSFGAQLPANTAARPTFVIAVQPSPSPSGAPRSPASTAVPPAVTTTSDQYTVEAGDTLRSIAEQVYGDPTKWPRIYDANRDTIGPDPDALSAGTRLTLPRP